MKQCPVCKESIGDSQLVCGQCFTRIHAHEMPRRETVLYAWGRGLMILLALVFFCRGMYALLDPASYKKIGDSIGLRAPSDALHYMNAALLLLTGILYGITWLGGYLDKKWHRPLCLVSLIVFVIGQLGVQFQGITGIDEFARGLALVFLWLTVPVFQYTAFAMGRPHNLTPDRPTEE